MHPGDHSQKNISVSFESFLELLNCSMKKQYSFHVLQYSSLFPVQRREFLNYLNLIILVVVMFLHYTNYTTSENRIGNARKKNKIQEPTCRVFILI